MAASLSFGSVPQFYREVYQIVCPNQENKIDKEMFVKILVKSSLPKSTLTMIWEAVDPKQEGFVTRDGLYKALAMTALAQQGKPVSEKSLESFVDTDLPKPSLGDLSDLKKLSSRVQREQNPNILGYNYEDLMALDTVEVELLAEKKGILLKHNEYHISSKRHNNTVSRRYNDFVAFHDGLLTRFPYRLVPKLPPKKLMGASKEFIEARRRALKRFLNVVARHPVLCNDRIVIFFFTVKGSDIGQKMKDQFKSYPDEFVTSPLSVGIRNTNVGDRKFAKKTQLFAYKHKLAKVLSVKVWGHEFNAEELVPMDVQASFNASKEQIRCIHNSVEKMKDIADRMTLRALGFSGDMLAFAKELSTLSADAHHTTVWASGNNDSWGHLKHGFNGLTGQYSKLSDKGAAWFKREDRGAGEMLALFLDITASYKDLCDRHEKGVLKDHQNALHKMQQMKKRQILSQAKGQENLVDALESKILEQEADISNMENRNFFSLHCLQLETQLVHANIKMIAVALEMMVASNSLGHKELAQIWAETYPAVENLVPKDTGISPPGSPSLM